MRRSFICLALVVVLTIPFLSSAQPGDSIKNEKESFIRTLNSVSNDPAIAQPVIRQFEREIAAIQKSIRSKSKLNALEKERAERSLVFFIKELQTKLEERKIGIYDVPQSIAAYKLVLDALIRQGSLVSIFRGLGPVRTQLMAASFSQYKEYNLLDDIAVYKRVSKAPQFILQFLESKPGFRFADSLLLDVAADDPQRIVYYLNRTKPGIQDKILSTKNIYLQQIASLSADKQASELLPFVTQIAEQRLKPEDIMAQRSDPHKYFQLMVNTLIEEVKERDPNSRFIKPLRKGIHQKAYSFYVNEINELHNSSDAVRFASVKGLRPEELYYIITGAGEDLYTSSYLGLYKRLMEHFKTSPADSLFELVNYDNLRPFVRLAANYNVLDDFLQRMSTEKVKNVLRLFIAGIESDENTALERAMDVADSFTALDAAPGISELFEEELEFNLNWCESHQHYLGIRLYSILTDIFKMVKKKDGIQELWTKLGDYEVLKKQTLEDKNGAITQVVLFYGDEDGVASFGNFIKHFSDSKKWELKKNDSWISIRSLSDQPLTIYANRPLEMKDGLDLRAQDSLYDHLRNQSLEPTVVVHRGHSYHLDKTINRLNASVKLAILGSCGGYNKAISIATMNPDIQVIGSKKTGSKSINDPIIDAINDHLVEGKDLIWPTIWDDLKKRFSKDPGTMSLFNEYFPPSDNLGLFVLKLFNYYNRII